MTGILWHEVRYAVRMLAASRGFVLIVIVTLGLGIGANASLFCAANALLFRSLPYRDPSALVVVTNARGVNRQAFSYLRAEFVNGNSRSLQGLAPFWNDNFNFTGRGDPERLAGMRVGWNFFEILGVRPKIGRTFAAEDDRMGGRAVALISESLWNRRFGADARWLGQSITLDSVDTTIIGVLPADFEFAPAGRSIDIWTSRAFEESGLTAEQMREGHASVLALARLRKGVSLDEAQSEMRVLDAQYIKDYAAMYDADPRLGISLNPVQELMVANVRTAILVVFGAVGCVLLISCANIASLLLSRAMARRKEMAIRAALGAGRFALIRELLVENILLALLGGAAGALLALAGIRGLAALPASMLPRINPIRMSTEVLAFIVALSLATGLLFGLIPALQAGRSDVQGVLREEGRAAAGGRKRSFARALLTIGQVALSLILLITASLLARSFANLENVPLGFDARDVLIADISLAPARYKTKAQIATFFDRLAREAATIPGVRSVALSSGLPLRPSNYGSVLIEGGKDVPVARRPNHSIQTVSSSFFETLRIPIREGRGFDERDRNGSARVAIVNDCFARRYWPQTSAVGKRIFIGASEEPIEVVGVSGNVKNIRLSVETVPEVYYPFAQHPSEAMHVILRGAVDPSRMVRALRMRVATVDPDQPITKVRGMEQYLVDSIAQNRFTMLLLATFSIVALAVATVGLYGLIAYSVAQRRQEFGVRLALGAAPGKIVGLAMRQGVVAALAGILLGIVGSLGVTRVVKNLLYQVSTTDASTLIWSSVSFLAIALAATYFPARRASRLDPAETLKNE